MQISICRGAESLQTPPWARLWQRQLSQSCMDWLCSLFLHCPALGGLHQDPARAESGFAEEIRTV